MGFMCQSGPGSIILVGHADCPSFSQGFWRLSEAPTVAQELGVLSSAFPIQFYDIDKGFWILCDLSTPHPVKTDGYLILRWNNVTCEDLDLILQRVGHKRPQFQSLSDQHTLKALGKKKKAVSVTSSDSEDIVELVNSVTTSWAKKGRKPTVSSAATRIKRGPPRSPPKMTTTSNSDGSGIQIVRSAPKRLRVHSPTRSPRPIIVSPLSSPISFPFPQPQPLEMYPASPTVSEATRECPSPVTGPPPHIPGRHKRWPASMYVVDMLHGFKVWEDLKSAKLSFEKRFEHAYPGEIPPASSHTVNEQITKWNQGPAEVKDAFRSAGHTHLGHWADYSRLIPLKD